MSNFVNAFTNSFLVWHGTIKMWTAGHAKGWLHNQKTSLQCSAALTRSMNRQANSVEHTEDLAKFNN